MGQAPPPWSWTHSAHAADRTGRGVRSTSSASGPSKGGERRRLGSGSPHSLAVLPSRTVTTRTPDLPARPPHSQVSTPRSTTGTVRRGQGYTLRASTIQAIHRQMLARCQPLDGGHGTPTVPAQRKARREYENASARSSRPAPDWASTRPGPRRHRAHRDRPVPQRTASPCRRSSTFSDDHPARPHGSRRAFKDTVFSHDSGSWVIARSRQTIPNSSSPSHWTLIVFRNTT